jgi:ACS family D-galactonate transporter-like MFS transporter
MTGSSHYRRWIIAALLGFGVLVNYFDRVNVSVAEQALHAEFGITTIQFAYLLGAYSWTYALCQLPAGVLLDRFGVRLVGSVSSFVWGIATFAAAAAPGLTSFFAARLLLGVGEAPTFPGNAKAVGLWFPEAERSLATAFFDSAAKLGPAIGVPVCGLLLIDFGWRASFAVTGVLSVLYFLAFVVLYRSPRDDKRLSAKEREHIVRGGGHFEERRGRGSRSCSISYLLRQRKVLGLVVGFASYNYCFYLLLSWLPSYLSTTMHIDLKHSVLFSGVPWLFAGFTDLVVGGWLVNRLIHRGFDASRVRRFVLIAGTACGLGILGAAYAQTPTSAVIWICISIGGLSAAAPVGWSIPALIAPDDSAGTLGGILNFGNQLSAIAAPVVTGYVFSATHSFAWAFVVATVFLLLGVAAYAFWLGKIERIANEPVIGA